MYFLAFSFSFKNRAPRILWIWNIMGLFLGIELATLPTTFPGHLLSRRRTRKERREIKFLSLLYLWVRRWERRSPGNEVATPIIFWYLILYLYFDTDSSSIQNRYIFKLNFITLLCLQTHWNVHCSFNRTFESCNVKLKIRGVIVLSKQSIIST